jgi:plastocyanin
MLKRELLRKVLVIVLLSCASAFALTSCNSFQGGSDPKSIRVTITDYAFTPNTFTVTAGAQISFTVTNNGALAHNFLIMQSGYQVQDHFTDAGRMNVILTSGSIPSGQTVTTTFTAPSDPSEYQVICGMPGHFEAGMVGKLIVSEP